MPGCSEPTKTADDIDAAEDAVEVGGGAGEIATRTGAGPPSRAMAPQSVCGMRSRAGRAITCTTVGVVHRIIGG